MYSRVTETSKTRIDYIFSNTNSCVYFQYLSVERLDHCIVLSRYELNFKVNKERVPRERYFDSWVISRFLDKDEEFLAQAEYIIKTVHSEISEGMKDFSFLWLKVKSALIQLAKVRQKEIYHQRINKIKIMQGFYSNILKGIQHGEERYDELHEIKVELNKIYKENVKEKIDKMKAIQIDDHTFDIHKLQNQKKFEGYGQIN